MKTYGMFSPAGLVYCGLHTNEDDVWQVFFGYPDDEEIEDRKQEGYCVREVCVFWRNPQNLASVIKYAIWRAITDLESHCRHRTYNYIATSIEDRKGNPHPFNIVEVPGENYKKIHDYGIETEEVKGFVNHIKIITKKY